jgi:protein-disulfide isomerase
MTLSLRPFAFGIATAAALFAGTANVSAQAFSDDQRQEIQKIVKEYLLQHPEVLQEVVQELEKRQAAAEQDRNRSALSKHRDAVYNSPYQVTLGNPQGDVTLVEFFDYNCGYCKRALGDKIELLKSDPKLKLVLKEFPVLGPGSIEAAQVAVAVRMQDKTGKKYFDFHQKLMSLRGQADKARAIAAAKETGFDTARIERDLGSDEVKKSLEESMMLAEALGINGTPTYVVGDNVVAGAIGTDALRKQIAAAREGRRSN